MNPLRWTLVVLLSASAWAINCPETPSPNDQARVIGDFDVGTVLVARLTTKIDSADLIAHPNRPHAITAKIDYELVCGSHKVLPKGSHLTGAIALFNRQRSVATTPSAVGVRIRFDDIRLGGWTYLGKTTGFTVDARPIGVAAPGAPNFSVESVGVSGFPGLTLTAGDSAAILLAENVQLPKGTRLVLRVFATPKRTATDLGCPLSPATGFAPGVRLRAKLLTTLDPHKTKTHDVVKAITTETLTCNGEVVVPEGARIQGHVTVIGTGDAQRDPVLRVVFEQISWRGHEMRFTGNLQAVGDYGYPGDCTREDCSPSSTCSRSCSSDYPGHDVGPRSHGIEFTLISLDEDASELTFHWKDATLWNNPIVIRVVSVP